MLVLDTSGLLAALDESERQHERCSAVLTADEGPLLLSPFVLAELDYLIATHIGESAELALLDEVGRGAYRLERFSNDDVVAAAEVIKQNADLGLGLADASIVVLARRYRCDSVLTLDERHFRALARTDATRFRLLPADN
jgi:uncharacterized protein